MYDVITVGSATVDCFADPESELIKIKSSRDTSELIAYPSGSKILIKHIQFFTGGGGTNTAVALSRLGHKVAFLGNLGKDANAKLVLEELKKNNVDFIGVKDKGMTGYSVVLKSIEHDRSILTYKGMNDDLRADEINYSKLKTRWFYFSSMMSESYRTLEKLAAYAEKNRIKTAFNPSNYLAEKGADFLKEILSRTEILILNKEEAELIAGRGDFDYLIKKLMELGPKIVVITNGKHGSHTFHRNCFYHIVPIDVKVTETTGAGDAFASSFLSGIIKKNDICFALKLGQVNAESVI